MQILPHVGSISKDSRQFFQQCESQTCGLLHIHPYQVQSGSQSYQLKSSALKDILLLASLSRSVSNGVNWLFFIVQFDFRIWFKTCQLRKTQLSKHFLTLISSMSWVTSIKSKSNQINIRLIRWQITTTDTDAKVVYNYIYTIILY